jgi:hypothetical protein
MNAIKDARRLIAADPMSESALTLTDLVISLESAQPFKLERIYALDMKRFELAVQIIKEWRLDRYYAGKSKLLDLSLEARRMVAPIPAAT